MPKSLQILVLLAVYFGLTAIIVSLDLGETSFIAVAYGTDVIALALLFRFSGWRFPTESRLALLPSFLFLLGAFGIHVIFQGALTDWLRAENPLKYGAPGRLGGVGDAEALSVLSIITALIIAPINEEILTRFFLFEALKAHTGKVVALLVSSLVFALIHFGALPTAMLPAVFVTGLCLGLTRITLGLPWAIGLHFFINLQPLLKAKGVLGLLDNSALFACFFALVLVGIGVFFTQIIRLRKTALH